MQELLSTHFSVPLGESNIWVILGTKPFPSASDKSKRQTELHEIKREITTVINHFSFPRNSNSSNLSGAF